MKITNDMNLPTPFVRAIEARYAEQYLPRADFWASGLPDSPRVEILKRHFWDQIEEDVSDLLWALWGTTTHKILEDAARSLILTGHASDVECWFEHRSEQSVEVDGKTYTVSARCDVIEDGVLDDYKTSSVYAYKALVAGDKKEWDAQVNINSAFAILAGIKVRAQRIVLMMKDWRRTEARRNRDLPQKPIIAVARPMWSVEQTMGYVRERVRIHAAARAQFAATGEPPECTDEEIWAKPNTWAVKKYGAQRATRVHDSEAAATAHAEEMGKGYGIEFRPGEHTRCEEYCSVSAFCSQHRRYLEAQGRVEAPQPELPLGGEAAGVSA